MEVFEYKVDGLFTVKASTNDVYSPWRKFHARILSDSDKYCSYDSNIDGDLRLYDYKTWQLQPVDKSDWNETRPVFYETNSYSFTIYFENIKEGTSPRIIHPDKRVSEMFNSEIVGNKAFLSGAINFLNEPGRFCLKFACTTSNDIERISEVSFDVVSPKLDTKEDLKTIIKEIRAEYDDLVFRYLTLTYQQFAEGHEANNDVIWLALFKQIIQGYLTAVRYIVHRPHFRDIHHTEYRHAERIKRWTPALAERFVNDFAEDKEEALRKMYRYQQTETTEDTRENRFVKYTICRMSERLQQILRRIKAVKDDNVSTDESIELESYIRDLEKLKRNSLFKTIGRFEGFRQESIVLQQRTGYAQVYRYWLMLQNGLDLVDGRTSVGVLPIWQLYEVWCFLKMKRIVREVLHIDTKNPDDLKYIHEKTTTMFNPFSDSEMSDSVTYDNKENGDQIELGYQYSYKRTKNGVHEDVHSVTGEQKPDIVMNIHKHNSGIVLTYLFDAKYRVKGEGDNDYISNRPDEPVEDTLNQMHRYRDAIYYGYRSRNDMAKEVIGAYILFPGRVDEPKYQGYIERQEYEKLPYYIRSIYQVNIGAYPLLPNDNSGLLLHDQVRRLINIETITEQIADSIPQRGMSYKVDVEPDERVYVLVGYYNDYQEDWMFHSGSIGQYNIRTDKGDLSRFLSVTYLLLYTKDNIARGLYKLKDGSHPRILSPQQIYEEKKYTPRHKYNGSYFYYQFDKNNILEGGQSLDVTILPNKPTSFGQAFVETLGVIKKKMGAF